ncbi:hypothetical protein [Streptomyces bullii]|uniref:Uncharacterized protein n=1 Tax=Streptomyces bullii TaxID=349910 RepID=A0ABW0URY7_9ACTN
MLAVELDGELELYRGAGRSAVQLLVGRDEQGRVAAAPTTVRRTANTVNAQVTAGTSTAVPPSRRLRDT